MGYVCRDERGGFNHNGGNNLNDVPMILTWETVKLNPAMPEWLASLAASLAILPYASQIVPSASFLMHSCSVGAQFQSLNIPSDELYVTAWSHPESVSPQPTAHWSESKFWLSKQKYQKVVTLSRVSL